MSVELDVLLILQVPHARAAEKSLPDAIFAVTEVRIRDDMFGGLVADGHETMLLLSQGTEKENLAIWSDHVGLNMISRGYFKHLWDTSTPVVRG